MPTKGKKTQPGTKKLAGKTVALVGKFGYGKHELDALKKLVVSEGGQVVDGLKTAPDLLVEGAGIGGNPPAAIAKSDRCWRCECRVARRVVEFESACGANRGRETSYPARRETGR